MEVVSIRVPKHLREEMSKLDLNWAEYLRKTIEEKVRVEKMKRLVGNIRHPKVASQRFQSLVTDPEDMLFWSGTLVNGS